MRDILSPRIFGALHDRYTAGVADAEAAFDQHRADEDSLTGALGQSLATTRPLVFRGPLGVIAVDITYRKLRGRGRNAPEKIFGADGIFQLEVRGHDGNMIRRKGLPFQAKTGWKGKDKKLLAQAQNMERHTPGSIVVDYSRSGYSACTAQAAIAANGSRAQVDRFGSMKKLGQVLGNDFLECKIGKVGLFYDADIERFADSPLFEGDLDVITTTVAPLG